MRKTQKITHELSKISFETRKIADELSKIGAENAKIIKRIFNKLVPKTQKLDNKSSKIGQQNEKITDRSSKQANKKVNKKAKGYNQIYWLFPSFIFILGSKRSNNNESTSKRQANKKCKTSTFL